MKWTDVNEALPDMKQRVLVVEQKHQGLRPCVYITKRIPHDETDPNCTRWHWANCCKRFRCQILVFATSNTQINAISDETIRVALQGHLAQRTERMYQTNYTIFDK